MIFFTNIGPGKYDTARKEVLCNGGGSLGKAFLRAPDKHTFKTPTLCTQIIPSHLSATHVSYYTNPEKRSLRRIPSTLVTASATIVFWGGTRQEANSCFCNDYVHRPEGEFVMI